MLDRIDVESIYPLLDRIDIESIYDNDDDIYLTSRNRDVPGAMPTLSILV